jgi:hypothetical protein
LDFYNFSSLEQLSAREDMSLRSDTLSWFPANQSFLLILINAACLKQEAANTNFKVFGLIWIGLELTINSTLREHTNYYTINGFCFDILYHYLNDVWLFPGHSAWDRIYTEIYIITVCSLPFNIINIKYVVYMCSVNVHY